MKNEWDIEIQSPTNQKIIGVVIFYFLVTFIMSRLVVYLILGRWLPNFFLTIRGVHIHHFTYGVIIIAINGLYLLLRRPETESPMFKIACAIYGIGLGLTFDEFGMWVRLADNYWVRQSYDAMIVVFLVLLNIYYYRYVLSGVKEIIAVTKSLINRLFFIQKP
jgi:hypothetical protein